MAADSIEPGRPIRVVVFTSGPVLERGVKRFICALEDHPQIDMVACIAQAKEKSRLAVYRSLWKRRGMLALPILLVQWFESLVRFTLHLRQEMAIKRKLSTVSEKICLVPDIHAQQVIDFVCRLSPDLGLIYGSPILKPVLFEIPRLGTLGIHHGKVPEYRGKKTMFWAMYNGEPTAGVTIQKVNAGLDTGQIVLQGAVPARRRLPPAVWRDLDQLGLELYIQAILAVKQGTAVYLPQSGQKGRLYRDPSAKDILKLWQRIILDIARSWIKRQP